MNQATFAFGKNWLVFLKGYLNDERIIEARESLVQFCGDEAIRQKSFVDVGCGSGLFSLAALELNASRILSFDRDEHSVECCRILKERKGNPSRWEIAAGSILDDKLVARLGTFDFVYSWGVLHHTGNLWKALLNTLKLVSPGGLLYTAIYNRADCFAFYPDGRFGTSAFWLVVKKFYSRLPLFLQNLVDAFVMALLILVYLLGFKNPVSMIRRHKELRGMSWRVDIKDWLGGYPYEYAAVDEVYSFVKKEGFTLENLKSNNGLRCNEYLFRRKKENEPSSH